MDPRPSTRRASLFLVILLSSWEGEQKDFREASKEQQTHPNRASGSGAAFKDSNDAFLDPRLSGRIRKRVGLGNVFEKGFKIVF